MVTPDCKATTSLPDSWFQSAVLEKIPADGESVNSCRCTLLCVEEPVNPVTVMCVMKVDGKFIFTLMFEMFKTFRPPADGVC